jgi:hypothetical protein
MTAAGNLCRERARFKSTDAGEAGGRYSVNNPAVARALIGIEKR